MDSKQPEIKYKLQEFVFAKKPMLLVKIALLFNKPKKRGKNLEICFQFIGIKKREIVEANEKGKIISFRKKGIFRALKEQNRRRMWKM